MSGVTIDQFVRERIFQPLGMRDTYYNVPREKVSRVAAVYRATARLRCSESPNSERRPTSRVWPG
jgi:CubicO group peptidase (beta-lactamase class C family)